MKHPLHSFYNMIHSKYQHLKNGQKISRLHSIYHPSSNMKLHDIFKDAKTQKTQIGDYLIDQELSNHNQQVYVNPKNQKVLINVTGTHNLSDIGTDMYHAFGHVKETKRYKEADQILKKTKLKYNTDPDITGHSLGGTIAGYIGTPEKTTTYNKGVTIGQKNREKYAYRIDGDLVSAANTKGIQTLSNKNIIKDPWNAHGIDHIQ